MAEQGLCKLEELACLKGTKGRGYTSSPAGIKKLTSTDCNRLGLVWCRRKLLMIAKAAFRIADLAGHYHEGVDVTGVDQVQSS